jgi:hypothetical protein
MSSSYATHYLNIYVNSIVDGDLINKRRNHHRECSHFVTLYQLLSSHSVKLYVYDSITSEDEFRMNLVGNDCGSALSFVWRVWDKPREPAERTASPRPGIQVPQVPKLHHVTQGLDHGFLLCFRVRVQKQLKSAVFQAI